MPTPSHPLLAAIAARLDLEDHDVLHHEHGSYFVIGETGCFASVVNGTLHVEARAALDVKDWSAARQLCDDVNHFLSIGRCIYDDVHRVVAVVADLFVQGEHAYDVEAVAAEVVRKVVNPVAQLQFLSVPQRLLGGRKAVPAPTGEVCGGHSPKRDGRRYTRTLVRGPVDQILPLVQDILLFPLLGWSVAHAEEETVAHRPDGARLVVRVARHPKVGWGMVISVRLPTPPRDIARLNLQSVHANRHLLGRWTSGIRDVEHRLFLPLEVLRAAGDLWAPANFVIEIVEALAATSTETRDEPALLRPVWPGDDVGAGVARRDPWNDWVPEDDVIAEGDVGPEDDSEWRAVYVDRLGRMSTITEPSFVTWQALLEPEDLAHDHVHGFIAFFEREVRNRDEGGRDSR